MLNGVTSRGGLTATTALVAVAVVMVTPAGREIWSPRSLTEIETRAGSDLLVAPELDRARPEATPDAALSTEPLAEPPASPEAARPQVTARAADAPLADELVMEEAFAAPETRALEGTQSLGAKRHMCGIVGILGRAPVA